MTAVTHVLFLAGGMGRNAIGGAEHHVLTLLHELARRGVDTEVIVLLWQDDAQIQATLAQLRRSGVRIRVIARRAGRASIASRLLRALDCWRRLSVALRTRRSRVIHMHMELVMQLIAARMAGCRHLVVTIHNDEPHYARPVVKAWLRRLAAWNVRLIAISDHVRRYLIEAAGLRPASVHTIRYGVVKPAGRTPSRGELGLAADDFVIGFVGRLTAQKNVQLLVRAMAQRPDFKCVVVGDGELRLKLEELARQLGCANVTFLGARPAAASLMPLFDVFCLPSVWEGLGVVLLEAMYQGVPIVASRAGAIPEVLEEGRFGILTDPSSVASLVAAIDLLHANPELRRALARAAHAHAAASYGVSRMGDETCRLYAELGPPHVTVAA